MYFETSAQFRAVGRLLFPMPNLRPGSQPKLGKISIRGGGPVTQAQLSIWLQQELLAGLAPNPEIKDTNQAKLSQWI
jgi:hypothetical protein